MNAVTKQNEQPIAQVTEISGGILEVIARAARDPNVDIEKMEKLLDMQERVQARAAKADYYAAMAEMQPEMPTIVERGQIIHSGKLQSKYALWEDVNTAIKPVLARHGFALSFKTSRNANEITVTGILSHRGGHSEETELTLPSDTSGSKNAVQAVGSSTSYGKRYTAAALLNLTTTGADDDGRAAGKVSCINEQQAKEMRDLLKVKGKNEPRFVAYVNSNCGYEVQAIEDIRADDYPAILKVLREA